MAEGKRKIERADFGSFEVTTQLDCHGRPLMALVTVRARPIDEAVVAAFGALADSRLAFPGFRLLDVPRFYRLGFSMGKDEIHVTFRQHHDPTAREELVSRLRAALEG